jgi:hypothetical protein
MKKSVEKNDSDMQTEYLSRMVFAESMHAILSTKRTSSRSIPTWFASVL